MTQNNEIKEMQIQELNTMIRIAELWLFGLPILIFIIILYYLTHAIPCTEPFYVKGCYVINNTIQWCCD